MVGKSGPSFCQGLHTKNGLDLLLAHGHGLVGLAKPYLIFYPLQYPLERVIGEGLARINELFGCLLCHSLKQTLQ